MTLSKVTNTLEVLLEINLRALNIRLLIKIYSQHDLIKTSTSRRVMNISNCEKLENNFDRIIRECYGMRKYIQILQIYCISYVVWKVL